MIGKCGDSVQEWTTEIGLKRKLDSHYHPCSGLRAHISFDIAEFIQYYVPTAGTSSSDSRDRIPQDVCKSPLDAQSDIYTWRETSGLFK